MKARILILDDDENRHNAFKRRLVGCEIRHVCTSKQCIDVLTTKPPFDLVCLDHDLDDSADGGVVLDAGDGMEVAVFIRLHLERDRYPRQVLIHSHNAPAAWEMRAHILEVGIPTTVRPYDPFLNWLVVR